MPPFALKVLPRIVASDLSADEGGCGCSTPRTVPTSPALLLLALVLIRRRRR